jgi:TPP-dependent 2-oxoacid decarboxylase
MPKHTPTTTPPPLNVGNYLLDALYGYGVEHIFGIPGDYILQFDKLIELHTIKFINATRENTAGYMADAYARLRGLGVVCITYGVGINIANALSQAYAESSPLVIISGTATLDEFATGHKLHHLLNKHSTLHQMDTTQLEIFTHFTVDQAVLTSPEEAKAQIDRVLWSCFHHKKPVYIEIPRDIATALLAPEQPTESHLPVHQELPQSTPLSRAIAMKPLTDPIKAILEKSKSPIIWAGHEILRHNLSKPLITFAEKYNIPIVSSLLGKTAVDENHPLFLGVYQGNMSRPEVQKFVEECDCLLQFGVLLSDVDTGIFTAKLEHPHKICASASELTIDNNSFHGIDFSNLIRALAESHFKFSFSHFAKAKIRHMENAPFTPLPKTTITAARLFSCIASQLSEEHIVATDFGDCLFGSLDFHLNENSFLSCAYFASLGFGTPAAIAAQLAMPHRRTIGIIGDGAFQMTSTELSTAVRYMLDPIIIILNNHGYGTERPLLEGSFNDIQNWNYSLMPQLLGGGIGVKVTTETAFSKALQNALQNRGQFSLIEVELAKTDFSPALGRFLSFAKK